MINPEGNAGNFWSPWNADFASGTIRGNHKLQIIHRGRSRSSWDSSLILVLSYYHKIALWNRLSLASSQMSHIISKISQQIMLQRKEIVTGSPKPTTRQQSPLACILCRHRHIKCDGVRPTCGRCESAGTSCTYVQSRRGQTSRLATPATPSRPVQLPALPGKTDVASDMFSDSGLAGSPPDWILDEASLLSNEVCRS